MQSPEQQCVDALRQCLKDMLNKLKSDRSSLFVLNFFLEDMRSDCIYRIERTLPMMSNEIIVDGYKLCQKIVHCQEVEYPWAYLESYPKLIRAYLKRLDAAYPVERPDYDK